MNEELKPCPFCGSDDVCAHYDTGEWRGSCLDCDSEGRPASSYELAVTAWNRRASPALIGLPVIDPSMLEGKCPPAASEAGLTAKEAWWAGARAALGLGPNTPRAVVAERLSEGRR